MEGDVVSTPKPNAQLHTAIASGDLVAVGKLLDNGANPNAPDQYGFSALARAAEGGRHEIVRLLLKRGANVEQGLREHSPLKFAVEANFRRTNVAYAAGDSAQERLADDDILRTVDALLDGGASVAKANAGGGTPLLTMAAIWCPLAVVKRLVEAGVDPRSGDALRWARDERRFDVADYLDSFSDDYEERKRKHAAEEKERLAAIALQRDQEERAERMRAENRAIQVTRRAQRLCINCGRPMSFFARFTGAERHSRCGEFRR
jgi:ankyrin repeat protein